MRTRFCSGGSGEPACCSADSRGDSTGEGVEARTVRGRSEASVSEGRARRAGRPMGDDEEDVAGEYGAAGEVARLFMARGGGEETDAALQLKNQTIPSPISGFCAKWNFHR